MQFSTTVDTKHVGY